MKTVKVVETAVGELKDWNWLSYTDLDGEMQFVEDEGDIEAAAVALKVNTEVVEAIKDTLQFLAQSLIEALEKDLADIWLVANGDED